MAPVCLAKGCGNGSKFARDTNRRISYHSFPVNPALRSRWLSNTSVYRYPPTPKSILCSDHFSEDSFKPGRKHAVLKKGSVPIFGHNSAPAKSKTQPSTTEENNPEEFDPLSDPNSLLEVQIKEEPPKTPSEPSSQVPVPDPTFPLPPEKQKKVVRTFLIYRTLPQDGEDRGILPVKVLNKDNKIELRNLPVKFVNKQDGVDTKDLAVKLDDWSSPLPSKVLRRLRRKKRSALPLKWQKNQKDIKTKILSVKLLDKQNGAETKTLLTESSLNNQSRTKGSVVKGQNGSQEEEASCDPLGVSTPFVQVAIKEEHSQNNLDDPLSQPDVPSFADVSSPSWTKTETTDKSPAIKFSSLRHSPGSTLDKRKTSQEGSTLERVKEEEEKEEDSLNDPNQFFDVVIKEEDFMS